MGWNEEVTVRFYPTCDGCGKDYGYEDEDELIENGWTVECGEMYCEECNNEEIE